MRGTVEEIYDKLLAVKSVINMRRNEGWRFFQDDEDWDYQPIYDERLCPICESFGGRMSGPQIPTEFSHWRREHPLWALEKNEVYPNTHESYPSFDLQGQCRCTLHWSDYMYVLTNRLWMEMEEATI